MARGKDEWIEVQEAAKIMSRNNKRTVSPDYVRLRAHLGKIRFKKKDDRQNYYLRSDVEAYQMRPKKEQEEQPV